jgi:glycerol-3-phosphate dehydrogenase subunit B
MPDKEKILCDLIVIGTGLAGLSAALFAARRGLDTVLVGLTGEIGFASGLLDLLGVHPVAEGRMVKDPWRALDRLRREEPEHPYSKMDNDVIRRAIADMLAFLAESGYPHWCDAQANLRIVTPVGTCKPTYAVPHTMQYGPIALAQKTPCLLVDFEGLKGYSAIQIAAKLRACHPHLRTLRIAFPEGRGELYTEHMARALETTAVRAKLIAAIRPHIGDVLCIGLPAILGIYDTVRVVEDLTQGLGRPVFEIPTMVPGVTGVRLQELFGRRLPVLGVRPLMQQRVWNAWRRTDRWSLAVGQNKAERTVRARSVMLCSGRFFGKGLCADRHGIRETIFDLPVVQPFDRTLWHNKDLLYAPGHPINRAGLAVDSRFRPTGDQGRAIFPDLFAAGTILAYQDWVRQKCGSCLAIATAYAAVTACHEYLKEVESAL